MLEPFLAKHLRPHQKSGLTFLYECVAGFKAQEYFGAILADEMGLGKTLQTICLVWYANVLILLYTRLSVFNDFFNVLVFIGCY